MTKQVPLEVLGHFTCSEDDCQCGKRLQQAANTLSAAGGGTLMPRGEFYLAKPVHLPSGVHMNTGGAEFMRKEDNDGQPVGEEAEG